MVNTNELRQEYEMIDHSRIDTESSFFVCLGDVQESLPILFIAKITVAGILYLSTYRKTGAKKLSDKQWKKLKS